MAQKSETPLHRAETQGHEVAIKARVEEKADVHAKDKVRLGEGSRVLGGRGGGANTFSCVVCMFAPEAANSPET